MTVQSEYNKTAQHTQAEDSWQPKQQYSQYRALWHSHSTGIY